MKKVDTNHIKEMTNQLLGYERFRKNEIKKKIIMKSLFSLIVLIVLIGTYLVIQKPFANNAFFSNNITNENTNNYNNKNNIIDINGGAFSYTFDLRNPEEMYKNNDYIAIIHVDKIYPATTYREKTNEYILPFIPGEATVLKVLKGNFASEHISFLRIGGMVTYAEYEKTLHYEESEKNGLDINENEKDTTYINYKFTKDDIDIEEDKTYLVYMIRDEEFHNKNEYTITCGDYCIREINIDKESGIITIKNNITNEFEKLEDAVSKKIKDKLGN